MSSTVPPTPNTPCPQTASAPATPTSASPAKRPLPTEFIPVGVSGRSKAKIDHRESPFIRFGRHYVRTISMFDLPSTVITTGLLRDPEEDPTGFSTLDNRRYDAFQALVQLVPTFASIIDNDEASPEAIQKWLNDFAGSLKLGASGAKSDDTGSLRGAVIDWLKAGNKSQPNLTSTLEREKKIGRGFRNDITGKLLCPVMLDWNDEKIRTDLLNGTATIDGNPINGSHWPAFLFAGEAFNKDLPWEGFLQGKYLRRAYCHIFTSPSSAKGDHNKSNATHTTRATRATRSGNAANYGMTAVTKPSIAYAAAQLAFALSEDTTFHKHRTACDAVGLYNAIMDFFEAPQFTAKIEDLLKWWNRSIFPSHHVEHSAANFGLAFMQAAWDRQNDNGVHVAEQAVTAAELERGDAQADGSEPGQGSETSST
ncbi:hypothetical protein C8Q79DRAFT_1008119 [Trametes meyenii]|nr:hypothetical protein C8Q79DRAFT_1008119 [Trametes meyenii]